MATKQQVLEKVTELLKDINVQYQQLQEEPSVENELKWDLFEATVDYFAAHVTLYNKLSKKDINEVEKTAKGEVFFTPPGDQSLSQVKSDAKDDDQPATEVTQKEEEPVEDEELVEDEEPVEDEDTIEEVVEDDDEEDGAENIGDAQQDVSEKQTTEPEPANTGEQATAEEPANMEKPADTGESKPEQPSLTTEVVNEVSIAEKEVQLTPSDLPEATVQGEPDKPTRPLTLNELISVQRKAGAAGANSLFAARRGDGDRISDIKSAISLNDKLLFIKDLFNGYSLAYSEAIELLNRYDDFASADAFLQANYAQKNNWADKQATVDKLYAILKKRFG